jgi:transcription elongation factor Elf1
MILCGADVTAESSMPKPETCAICGTVMLSVTYYGADGRPVGGHLVCSNCGPRSAVDIDTVDKDVRSDLLERKAS